MTTAASRCNTTAPQQRTHTVNRTYPVRVVSFARRKSDVHLGRLGRDDLSTAGSERQADNDAVRLVDRNRRQRLRHLDLDLSRVDDLDARQRGVDEDDNVAARVHAHALALGVDVDDGALASEDVHLLADAYLRQVQRGALRVHLEVHEPALAFLHSARSARREGEGARLCAQGLGGRRRRGDGDGEWGGARLLLGHRLLVHVAQARGLAAALVDGADLREDGRERRRGHRDGDGSRRRGRRGRRRRRGDSRLWRSATGGEQRSRVAALRVPRQARLEVGLDECVERNEAVSLKVRPRHVGGLLLVLGVLANLVRPEVYALLCVLNQSEAAVVGEHPLERHSTLLRCLGVVRECSSAAALYGVNRRARVRKASLKRLHRLLWAIR